VNVFSSDRDLEEFLASRQTKRVQRERFRFGRPEDGYDTKTEELREQIRAGQTLGHIERTAA
jgi:hypothetical protein